MTEQEQSNRARTIDFVKDYASRFARVAQAHDPDEFGKELHSDWFMVDARGQVFTKEQELELLRGSDFSAESLNVQDLHVELFGDTAVVTGISSINANFENEDISGRYRFTQVWKHPSGQDLTEMVARGADVNTRSLAMVTCITLSVE